MFGSRFSHQMEGRDASGIYHYLQWQTHTMVDYDGFFIFLVHNRQGDQEEEEEEEGEEEEE